MPAKSTPRPSQSADLYRIMPKVVPLIKRSSSKRAPVSTTLSLKVQKSVEKKTAKNRYRSKKFLRQMQKRFDEDREWVDFKVYQEEKLFTPDMRKLEEMFLESQKERLREQGLDRPVLDEDVETDEEILARNLGDVFQMVTESISEFSTVPKKKKRELVRNYENKKIFSKKFFEVDY